MTPVRLAIAALLAFSGALVGSPAGHQAAVPGRLATLSRGALAGSGEVPDYGSYSWPVRGRVIRGFEPPPGPYEAGHRGIDIAAPFGSNMQASREGTVAFAGWVAGALFISVDHADGVRTTYSWLSEVLVHEGQQVAQGELIGRTDHGHPEVPEPHLHFGARVGSTYIDPMLLLEGADASDLIHLAPLVQNSLSQDHAMEHVASRPRAWSVAMRGPPVGRRNLE